MHYLYICIYLLTCYSINDNPFKVVHAWSLAQNKPSQAILKHETQKTFKILIEEKSAGQVTKTNKWYWCDQKRNTQHDWKKSMHGVTYTIKNELSRQFNQQIVRQPGDENTDIYNVFNSETMLKCKTNKWRLAYPNWNITRYLDYGSDNHESKTSFGFALMIFLLTTHYITMPW